MTESYTPEFPISYLFEHAPRPDSEPILEMHAHESIELGYCHTSSGILMADNRILPFSAGDICVIKEGVAHMSRSSKGDPSHWSYFWVDEARLLAETPEALGWISSCALSGPDFPYILPESKYEDLCLDLLEIVHELKKREQGHRVITRSLCCAFLGKLSRLFPTVQEEKRPSHRGLERIAPALQYMATHYADPITVETLADTCSISTRSFWRLFSGAIGNSPLQYLAQIRVRMAAAILSQTDKPISLVAYEVGFESINTFNRQFQLAFQTTPSQWRQAHSRL